MAEPSTMFAYSPMAPSDNCFAIVPSDTVALPTVTKGIYVGTGGDIVLRSAQGQTDVAFRNVPSGGIIDIRAIAVRLTGTTAADLVGLA